MSMTHHDAVAGDNKVARHDATAPVVAAIQHDPDLEDLVFSWQRLRDPKLRAMALRIIQSMAS